MTEAVRFPIHDSSTAVGLAAARLADLEARHVGRSPTNPTAWELEVTRVRRPIV